ncbi:MAG: isopentenyl-diphosphate Delta-isomerase [Cyclobacteriaceae bacterium]|nr:isopentenyl-diphosphate Delta-isomerase [Cyclobacteriaceae bacterium]
MEEVILVDEQDVPIGTMEKLQAHELGLLHRAFSVLIFNSKGELLLQQRADDKYHSGGLWTNTCCSHPQPDESMQEAVKRKLFQEMGLQSETHFAFSFIYQAKLDNDLTEHELDHVYIGYDDSLPLLNPKEAKEYKYLSIDSIKREIKVSPHSYTEWFKILIQHPSLRPVTIL